MKDKVVEQGEKRKKDKKNKKQPGQAEEGKMGEISLFGKKKGGKGAGFGDDMTAEEAHELIDELKNDLKVKEMEFDEMKARFAKLEAENARLRGEFFKERDSRLVIEGKLKKTAIHSELKEAREDITKNTFFEKKRSKLSSLDSTLLSSVTFICIC